MKILIMGGLSALLALSCALLLAGDPAKGKELFTAKCAPCHDVTGNGKEAIARLFQVTMKPLASKEIQAKPDDELRKITTKGSGKMVAVKVGEQEAGDIIAFVRTLAKK